MLLCHCALPTRHADPVSSAPVIASTGRLAPCDISPLPLPLPLCPSDLAPGFGPSQSASPHVTVFPQVTMTGATRYFATDLARLGLDRFAGCRACFCTPGPASTQLVLKVQSLAVPEEEEQEEEEHQHNSSLRDSQSLHPVQQAGSSSNYPAAVAADEFGRRSRCSCI